MKRSSFMGIFWSALVVLALFGGLGMGEGVTPTGLDMAICSGVTFFNYLFFRSHKRLSEVKWTG
jgi:hypothetical protein